MYDPNTLLALIDAHRVPLICIFFTILAFNIALYVEAIRVGRRDRMLPFPLGMIILWFDHDFSYVIRPQQWFSEYGHWFLTCCWAIMVITAFGEAVLIGLALRHGRGELAPGLSPLPYRVGLAAVVAASLMFFEFVHSNLSDPFFLVALHVAFLLWGPFVTARTLRMGSRRGQSLTMHVCYFCMQALWVIATFCYFGEEFRNWRWVLTSVVMLAWTAAAAVIYLRTSDDRAPVQKPDAGAPAAPARA